MSVRRRLWKLLKWGTLLVLTVVVGGSIAAYHYATDSDNLADLVRREAPRFLPGCRVDVSKVTVRPFAGKVTLTQLLVRERAGDEPGPTVGGAARIQVRYNPWAMSKGRFEPRKVTVAEATLRLRRKPDGSWNQQGLLADPWPGPLDRPTPPIFIQEGIVELSEEDAKAPLKILRDVSIKVPATAGSGAPVSFELTAKGDFFDRVHIEGTVDPGTGRVELKAGELVRMNLSESLRDRLPAQLGDALKLAGLAGGEVDAELASLTFDPSATPKLHYQGSARLRRGLWKCPKLPFPISDLSVDVQARDGELTITRADGSDGSTGLSLRGHAMIDPDDPRGSPFEVHAEATKLELDERLLRWLPPEVREIWLAYFPRNPRTGISRGGSINLSANFVRPRSGAEVGVEVDVDCLDVSMEYKHFKYPVDHIQGKIRLTPDKVMTIDVSTLVGNRPLHVTGRVENPGLDAVAHLYFDAESLPLDAVLFNALPPEVFSVVDSFKPTGTVRGHAELERLPPLNRGDDPRGRVKFDARIDLNPGCSITWDGLKYPVMNLTGKLEIHPHLWTFSRMRGNNGQAAIRASGEVNHLKPPPSGKVDPRNRDNFKVDLRLQAKNIPFDQQLRDALPTPWQVTWATLNPTGASDIDATIKIDPGRPEPGRERYRVVIVPRKQSGVKLRFNPLVGAEGAPAGPIELRMDDVTGHFVYDTATSPPTTMTDVDFTFHQAPVRFSQGVVDVKDNGQFQLGVSRLEVSGLRLDEELRRYMPPVMAQFARRLDDMKIPSIKANLGLGWSGRPGESAWCSWNDARVILNDNKVSVGTDLGLDHIQGELYPVNGKFDGHDLDVHGKLNLASVSVFGQQVTELSADLDVQEGLARLDRISGKVLGGDLDGHLRASLDATPNYSVFLRVKDADLRAYAMNQPGHQKFRGLVTAMIDISGLGYDPHAITGDGSARIVQGELGTLPVAIRFFNVLKLAKETRTAFDSAELVFKIDNGETTLDPVRLVGNAFSLDGKGKVDVQGEIDLKLRPVPGRDSVHVPLLSVFTRELSGQILVVRVQGPIGSPSFKLELIPGPGELLRANKRHRDIRRTGLIGPWRTGLEPRLGSGLASRWFGQGE